MQTKTCTKCNTIKTVNQFYADKASKDGLKPRCKLCMSEYKQDNKVKVAEYGKVYYQLNKVVTVARIKAWRQDNKAKIAEQTKAYRQANPDQMRAYAANRRAMKRNATGKHTPADINALFVLQKGQCVCCKMSIKDGYHVDHIYPLITGGGNGKYNLQLLCQPCNNQKSVKDPIVFMQSRGFLL